MSIDLFLKKYREIHRLEQKEIANRLGISRPYYAKLESGMRKPSVDLLEKICTSLGTSIVDVIKNRNGDPINEYLQELVEHFVMMDEEERKRLVCKAREIISGGGESWLKNKTLRLRLCKFNCC